MAPRKFSDC